MYCEEITDNEWSKIHDQRQDELLRQGHNPKTAKKGADDYLKWCQWALGYR